jgi:hypothetical protein
LDFFQVQSLVEDSAGSTAVDEDELRKSKDVNVVAARLHVLVRSLGELVLMCALKDDDVLSVLDTIQGTCTPDGFNRDDDHDGGASASLRGYENVAVFKDYLVLVVLDTLVRVRVSLWY